MYTTILSSVMGGLFLGKVIVVMMTTMSSLSLTRHWHVHVVHMHG